MASTAIVQETRPTSATESNPLDTGAFSAAAKTGGTDTKVIRESGAHQGYDTGLQEALIQASLLNSLRRRR